MHIGYTEFGFWLVVLYWYKIRLYFVPFSFSFSIFSNFLNLITIGNGSNTKPDFFK